MRLSNIIGYAEIIPSNITKIKAIELKEKDELLAFNNIQYVIIFNNS